MYEQLYKEQVLGNKSGTRRRGGNFSSDDEVDANGTNGSGMQVYMLLKS